MPQPLGIYHGRVPNPNILYGQDDMENAPTTFARIATRWADVQLSNGWQNTNYGKRFTFSNTGYLASVVPVEPGATRLSGRQQGDFPMRGPAPSQWDFHVNNGPGSQPSYPGGPGFVMGQAVNPGNSGG